MLTGHLHDTEGAGQNGDTEHVPFLASSNQQPSNQAQRAPLRRQSSIVQPGTPRTSRTANRVRFDLQEPNELDGNRERGHDDNQEDREDGEEEWLEGEDYFSSARRNRTTQRAPLLTGIEAPSVTTALDINVDELLETARPKSGLSSAFMNMANSIIGAGIIGMDLRKKERSSGLLINVGQDSPLTGVVDWTIRLIVINSKISGANSFQGTVEFCFGRSGLIAISVAQWSLYGPAKPGKTPILTDPSAFGGMVAFCIIIGDTIPSVIAAMFPSLSSTPFFWLLTDRRAIIILCVLCLSYPLSLYRDIAKLAKASMLALLSMATILVTIITQGAQISGELKGNLRGSLLFRNGIVDAVGTIAFAFVCHHNSLLIYGSLKRPTLDRFARVTHFSTFTSMLACLAMALAGFLSFGDKTQGNILNNFPRDNSMVNIARLYVDLKQTSSTLSETSLFGLNMLTTLPLGGVTPCRTLY
ncbi:hypothetical protein ACLMJK_007184 [Lecanora helva]